MGRHRYIAGVDIGNSSTEVALAQIAADGQLQFVASAMTETTGIKGTQRNIFGINKALNMLVEKAGIALSDISLIRINEATPSLVTWRWKPSRKPSLLNPP